MRRFKFSRFAFQPALINNERVGFREDDCAFHDILQFADIAGPIVRFEELQRVLADVPDVLAGRLGVAPNEILLESLVPLSYPMVYRSSASMRLDLAADVIERAFVTKADAIYVNAK